jgi:hypothetical protein
MDKTIENYEVNPLKIWEYHEKAHDLIHENDFVNFKKLFESVPENIHYQTHHFFLKTAIILGKYDIALWLINSGVSFSITKIVYVSSLVDNLDCFNNYIRLQKLKQYD